MYHAMDGKEPLLSRSEIFLLLCVGFTIALMDLLYNLQQGAVDFKSSMTVRFNIFNVEARGRHT